MITGLSRSRAALLVVDIQERLMPAMPEAVREQVVRNSAILIEAAHRLGLPIVVSAQYPKGLGPTVAPIEDALRDKNPHRYDKLEFSAGDCDGFAAIAPKLGRDQWIVCGMETHVCVYQTARGLVGRGYQVHVAADAVCSRTKANWRVGLGLIERAGGIVTSTEVCVFDLLGRAGSDEFKALSQAIK
ncbi:MAG: isochorismatase hydrolase [Myxococcales bacterium]|nr:isochorismatase hydrolase [Myxococcales bacterium]